MLRYCCAMGFLVFPSIAFAWPTAEQWIPVEQGGAVLTDEAVEGLSADIVGDSALAAFSWYGDTDTLWFGIRVATERYDDTLDIVGVGFQTSSEDVVVSLDASGERWSSVGSGEWCVESDENFGTSGASGLDSRVTVEPTSGTTFIEIQVLASNFEDPATLAMLAFHAAPVSGDWQLDLAGWDETTGSRDCDAGWSDTYVVDEDGDGLLLPAEQWSGSDPLDADSDDDGRLDGEEGTRDSDEDGIPDVLSCDADGDGLYDGTEVGLTAPFHSDTALSTGCFVPDADPSDVTDPTQRDTDGGGLSDGIEDWNFNGRVDEREVDPTLASDDADRDGDTIADILEGTGDEADDTDEDGFKDYKDEDSDGDGIPDEVEFLYDTDGDGTEDFRDVDSDGDGLGDSREGMADFDGDGLMNFRDTDSDNDGKTDGDEGTGDDDCDGQLNYLDADDGAPGEEVNCDDKAPKINNDDFQPSDWNREQSYRDGAISGGCSALSGGNPSWLWVLATFCLSLFRSRVWCFALLGLASGASAQSAAVNANRYNPSLSAGQWDTIQPGQLEDNGTFLLSLSNSYARNPLTFRSGNEVTETVPLVSDLLSSHLNVGYSLGRVQFGMQAPVTLLQMGSLGAAEMPIGDLRAIFGTGVTSKNQVLSMAIWAAMSAPTGDSSSASGAGIPQFSTQVSGQWSKKSIVAVVSTGFETGTGAELLGLRMGPNWTWGVGFNGYIRPHLFLGGELNGAVGLNPKANTETKQDGAIVGEWALRGGIQVRPDVQLSLAGGTRIGHGVGAPDVRGTLAVHWSPRLYDPIRNPNKVDTDGDGIVDFKDACKDQPEDFNGNRDEDGCPDEGGLVTVLFEVVDAGGRLVAGAQLDLVSGDSLGGWLASDGTVRRALEPGRYILNVNAPGFLPLTDYEIIVPKVQRHGIRLTLIAPQEKSRLLVRLEGTGGKPIDDALVRIYNEEMDENATSGADGVIQFSLRPGAYELSVSISEGAVEQHSVTLKPGGTTDKTIIIANSESVDDEKTDFVQLNAKIFFERNQVSMRTDAFPILNSVVAVLNANPEIRRVRINGHADGGREASNALDISQKRANVVYEYLLNLGIDPDRLVVKGYGYNVPLQTGSTESVHRTNRRVEFSILEFGE